MTTTTPRRTTADTSALRIGAVIRLAEHPGRWQIIDRAPERGHWWAQAIDPESQVAGPWALEVTDRDLYTPKDATPKETR